MITTSEEGAPIKTLPVFDILFKTRNWRVIGIRDDVLEEGPMMYHVSCGYATYILYEKKATCHGCDVIIPNRIQVIYTLLNFDNKGRQSYFKQGERHEQNTK